MNKKFVLGLIVVIGLFFPLAKVMGACGCNCGEIKDFEGNVIGCDGHFAQPSGSDWGSCTINPAEPGIGMSTGTDCSHGDSICSTGGCPDGSNDDPCRTNHSYWSFIGGPLGCKCRTVDGIWDGEDVNDEEACIRCNGGVTENFKMADTSGTYGSTNPGDGECEELCGADSQCDEAKYDEGIIVAGGHCDYCVFTAGAPEESHVPSGLIGGLVPCGRYTNDPGTAIDESAPCTLCHLFVLFKRVVDFVTVNIIFPLAVLMFVIGGAMLLIAGGDPGKIGLGRKILKATVIGLVIILAAWLIVNTIILLLFTDDPLNPYFFFRAWHTIICPVT
ncbi:TrbC/VirB2 family protein [Patescibacteria group bacterium]|nr:TrbC/VirB2 family protein [Patescibacteria group bacterium]